MTNPVTEFPEPAIYAVAVAVVQQILRLAPQHGDEARVWRSFATSQGRNQVSYFEAVQRTRHSLFHYELQRLTEFGIGEVPADYRESFCLLAGRTLGASASEETVYPLLRAVGEYPGGCQEGLLNMVQTYLLHYTGDEYSLSSSSSPDEIVLRIKERFPERATAYFQYYGLDPGRCFQHNLEIIAGALDAIFCGMIRPYDSSRLRCLCAARQG